MTVWPRPLISNDWATETPERQVDMNGPESQPHCFSGVHVALLTPMTDDEQVSLEALRRHVNRLIDDGADGLVALGSTGEFSDLTVAEQDGVLDAVVDAAAGRVPVIAGVGALGTPEACQRVETAAAMNVDGILALPPLYWDASTLADLTRHFLAIAESSPVPVVLYDFPSGNRRGLDPTFVCDLKQKTPSLVGIKQTVHDTMAVEAMLSTIRRRHMDLAVAVGFEKLALSSLALGSRWLISGLGNFCTPLLRQLVSAVREANYGLAIDCHATILRLSTIYSLSNPPITAIKTAAMLCGFPTGPSARSGKQSSDNLPAQVRRLLQECQDESAKHVKAPVCTDK